MRDDDDDGRDRGPHNDRPTRPRFPDRYPPDGPPARPILWYAAFLLLGVALGGLGITAGTYLVSRFRAERGGLDPNAQLRTTTPAAAPDAEEAQRETVFEKVRPSVVNVDVVMVKQGRWDEAPSELQTSGGSGFVWDESGRVVTNYHVVAEVRKRQGTELRVVLADRTAYTAALIGVAPDNDLAVLQISAPKEKLKPIQVGTSDDLKVGRTVYAIGNPFGLSLSMTTGIISSLNRIIEAPSGVKIPKAIQTDAAINPGNSGGPLLDKTGRLIGVNTSIATPNGGNVGIGFAIPVDTVNRVVTELIQSGRSLRPDLGVKLYDERQLRRARYDHGVMIDRVVLNGPADAAGLKGCAYSPRGVVTQAGDLIVAINGEPIDNVEDYERVVRGLPVGGEAKVKIVRFPTKEMELTVTVGGV
ncbi:Periplasmic serine endoprotease DegP precursor [Gemmata obscuriglobus]|uniref:PDZ domain-containing protein n=1 Tax=Gemmata obscuriglobus TaxID=114 RepID=A0A2Z3H7L0_9BACT|nr:trypsin-like peptidase domain-containing protein [Gemmata obscuriglobus]AWM38965.1 PDZ domain-containing protein [Gemmata obscuriglobus]QEG28019.1 Periplasmic serine endoprotease DegP precursor [Gemmata obscuriglobus]VTS05564.1 2-alkenal reductase : 2-alkenal reductase OS=Candidatus Entotheonella sp. TSY2 GN=ETSY2_00310 PE=4 SV=1: Trypsin_2: PDZ_2 [Gemmata obscuriglobus UQM 2246]